MTATTLRVDTSALPAAKARQLLTLVERANRGDEPAMCELVPMLDTVPALARQLGDMTAITRGAWVDRIAGDQLALAEAIRRDGEALRAELAQPSDGPIELLLIERVVTCRLHLEYVEGAYARGLHDLSIDWSDAYQRRIDRAQRRFLQAGRALAQVRRLAVPAAVQANIAEHQVNHVGAAMTSTPAVRTVA